MGFPHSSAPKPRPVYVPEPMLVVLDEKHEPMHFLVKNDVDLFTLALQIVRVRVARRWYEETVTFDDGCLAWEWLRSRREAEYEGITLQKFSTVYR